MSRLQQPQSYGHNQHVQEDHDEYVAGAHSGDEGENFDPSDDNGGASGFGETIESQFQPVDNTEVHKIFDRGTAAGRAMYKLYNKNKTSYTPGVAVHTRESNPQLEAEAKRRREAALLQKKKYNAPKLKKAEKEPDVGRVPLWGGKKTSETIDLENERDSHMYKAPSVPLAKLQARDNEKKKLQEAHLHSGVAKKSALPAPLPGKEKISVPSLASRKSANEILYDRIIEEIHERQVFLDQMRAMGNHSHDAAVKAEIAHRLRDIKKLEKIIQEEEEDKQALRQEMAHPRPASSKSHSSAAATSSSHGMNQEDYY